MALVRSLRARVILWVSVALTVLFAVTIVGLDVAFRDSAQRALFEVLEAQAIGLIAVAEQDAIGELTLPTDLPAAAIDPQLELPESGLYAALFDGEGRILWQSRSLVGRSLPIDTVLGPNERRYVTIEAPSLPPLETLLMGIDWEFEDGQSAPYMFAVAVSLEPYNARHAAFRRNLIGWFAGITLTMLIVISGLLRFVMWPLKRLERQVREVEAGERMSLTGNYPTELVGLAGNLNDLIDTERRRLQRYRNTLDDLAHSLKTPLAAMRTLLPELRTHAHHPEADALGRELERMDQRVSHQLRRARASGSTGLGVEPVAVAPLVEDLKQTLDKVYRDKRVTAELELAANATFRGDPGDLAEILGNLMDNAYKYCRSRVRVTAAVPAADRLVIEIGDDGRGITPDQAANLFQRGRRADESVPGQGIGLAVVREIVELYQGTLNVARSELGGAKLRVELARAGAA
jgi:two-component system, OmpR family, sensor histidine kinase PhoQ